MRSRFIYYVFGVIALLSFVECLINGFLWVQGLLLGDAALAVVSREIEAVLVANGYYLVGGFHVEEVLTSWMAALIGHAGLCGSAVGVLWCYAKRQSFWKRLSPRGVRISIYVGESFIFIALLLMWFWTIVVAKPWWALDALSWADIARIQHNLQLHEPAINYSLGLAKHLWNAHNLLLLLLGWFSFVATLCWAVRAKRKTH